MNKKVYIAILIVILTIIIQLRIHKSPSTIDAIECIETNLESVNDSSKVAIIGDSWVATREIEFGLDEYLEKKNVIVNSFGQGTASSRKIYENLLSDPSNKFSSNIVLSDNYDYCIVISGVVDLSQIHGENFYTENICRIINQLNKCGVKPIVVSIPLIDLDKYYQKQSFARRTYNLYKKLLIHYSFDDQRESYNSKLKNKLNTQDYIFIDYTEFIDNYNSTHPYYLNETHLNSKGLTKFGHFLGEKINSEINE